MSLGMLAAARDALGRAVGRRLGRGLAAWPGRRPRRAETGVAGDVALVAADATALPLPDGVADLTLAMHMLYHVPDPSQAVRELRRVTRPGGRVVIGLNGLDHLRELRDDRRRRPRRRRLGRPRASG